jgi:hypothetical protein
MNCVGPDSLDSILPSVFAVPENATPEVTQQYQLPKCAGPSIVIDEQFPASSGKAKAIFVFWWPTWLQYCCTMPTVISSRRVAFNNGLIDLSYRAVAGVSVYSGRQSNGMDSQAEAFKVTVVRQRPPGTGMESRSCLIRLKLSRS